MILKPLDSIALGHHPLSVRDRARRVEPFWAGIGAIHDGVTAIEAKRVLKAIETLASTLVPAVDKPAMRLQQDRWAEIAILVPPVAWARGRAAKAENTFPRAVELCAFLRRLPPLAIRRGLVGLQPWLDQSVLRIESGEICDEIFQDLQVRKRRDAAGSLL